eukprot:14630848-Alexandrium_andersonii.AAC.1
MVSHAAGALGRRYSHPSPGFASAHLTLACRQATPAPTWRRAAPATAHSGAQRVWRDCRFGLTGRRRPHHGGSLRC